MLIVAEDLSIPSQIFCSSFISHDYKLVTFQFTWRVMGTRSLNIFQGRRITIPPNVLVANQNQTLVVSVRAPGQQVAGMVSIT